MKKISIADKETLDIVNANVSENKEVLNAVSSNVEEIKSNFPITGLTDSLANGTSYMAGSVTRNSIPDNAEEFLNISGKGILNSIMYIPGSSSTTSTFGCYLQIDGGQIYYITFNKEYLVEYTLLLPFKKSLLICAESKDIFSASYQLFE